MGTTLKLLYSTASKLCVITNERLFAKIFIVEIVIRVLFEKAMIFFSFAVCDSSY